MDIFKELITKIFSDILKDLGVISRPKEIICPNCSSLMKQLTISFSSNNESLFIDSCPQCEGIWFDRGELIKALQINIKYISQYFPSKTKVSEKGSGKRVCPICKSYLALVTYSEDSDIWVDVCTNGCGIFLDAGELELIKIYSQNLLTYPKQKEITSTNNELINQIKSLSSKTQEIKTRFIEKLKLIEQDFVDKDIKKLKNYLLKNPFEEEIKELQVLSKEAKELYDKYGSNHEIDKVIESLTAMEKLINIRVSSLKEKVPVVISELEAKEEAKEKEVQKITEILLKPSLTSEETLNSEKTLSTKDPQFVEEHSFMKKPNVTEKPSITEKPPLTEKSLFVDKNLISEKTSSISNTLYEQQKLATEKNLNFKVEKIKLSSYENLLNYAIIIDNLIIFSENKVFIFRNNSFEELKLNLGAFFRIKNVKVIENRLYLLGSSGNILVFNIKEDGSFEDNISMRISYSDLVDIVKVDDSYIVSTGTKVFLLDKDFKVIKEISLNANFLEIVDDKILLGYSSLVFIDKNLNKIEEINLKTYSQLKRIKKIDNSFYLMGSGFLAKLEEKNIVNLNLPKNYLEVNDINKKENVYFLASNSGGFYYTTNFIDYQVIKLDTFDNINKIVDFGDIYLICSNSTVFKIKY